MSNMSYCRFENTASDLRDCADNLDDDGLSVSEAAARVRLVRLCQQVVDDMTVEDAEYSLAQIKKRLLDRTTSDEASA